MNQAQAGNRYYRPGNQGPTAPVNRVLQAGNQATRGPPPGNQLLQARGQANQATAGREPGYYRPGNQANQGPPPGEPGYYRPKGEPGDRRPGPGTKDRRPGEPGYQPGEPGRDRRPGEPGYYQPGEPGEPGDRRPVNQATTGQGTRPGNQGPPPGEPGYYRPGEPGEPGNRPPVNQATTGPENQANQGTAAPVNQAREVSGLQGSWGTTDQIEEERRRWRRAARGHCPRPPPLDTTLPPETSTPHTNTHLSSPSRTPTPRTFKLTPTGVRGLRDHWEDRKSQRHQTTSTAHEDTRDPKNTRQLPRGSTRPVRRITALVDSWRTLLPTRDQLQCLRGHTRPKEYEIRAQRKHETSSKDYNTRKQLEDTSTTQTTSSAYEHTRPQGVRDTCPEEAGGQFEGLQHS
ncbi:collagen alpha-1(X) chain-like [Portunus trituberculatus]|uniref:collagen alpha-1(X) chain-like n=1 Tax=Portunus trituberculatus TaxID=210409 RepID=UPI001E1CBB64|nr:collagen alpha-1(X) chain-like [Portunus trituberculatus]